MESLNIKLFFVLNHLAGRWGIADAAITFFAVYVPYLLGASLLFFIYWDKRSLWEKFQACVLAGLSVTLSRFILTPIIRSLYHHPRPFLALEGVQNILGSHNAGSSLPSGHAAFFFALAAAVYVFDRRWGVGTYALVFCSTIARVIAGVHYPWDIVVGAGLGVGVTYLVRYLLIMSHFWSTRKVL
jgi:undecaprenyl-diphosphatase